MPKITIPDIAKKKAEGRKITVLTAYDFPTAQIVDEAGIDIALVGDSLGMVVQGIDSTLPVTMDEMIYHTRMVARAVKTALVVGDMPFLSYQASVDEAVRNAGRFLKEAGAEAVKLEGGTSVAATIRAIVAAGIPVMGHIGLTPQHVHALGGFKVQGRDEAAREKILADARAVQESGAFSVVLEAIPSSLAREIGEHPLHPDHRHRCGPALRRPGAGASRPARPVRPVHAQVRETVRIAQGPGAQSGKGL